MKYLGVWACPELLSKKIYNEVSRSFGLAQNFCQKIYIMKYPKVWACPELLSKNKYNEVSRSLGIHEYGELNYFW